MSGVDPGRVRALFLAACDRGEESRVAYLDRECGEDAALRERVEALLAQDGDGAGRFSERAVADGMLLRDAGVSVAPEPGPLAAGGRIGPYRIVKTLGVGGMGTVYEAEQDDPRRVVALKVLRGGIVSPELRRRFAHEAEVLARLKHPGIAQVFDAGTFEDGEGPRPYIAMERVDGVSLRLFCDEERLSIVERVELVARVCDAVHYAHERRVVHRDLKPANILVSDDRRPRILDFGVARMTGEDTLLSTLHTVAGQLMGTIPYMSPEQVGSDPDAVDARSDVYSLGVMLYELLAGRLPYDMSRLAIPEAARVIRDEEPTRLGVIDPRLRGDLEAIVEQALAKERERRYPSAADLAADLRRFVGSEPVRARRLTTFDFLLRFARRHKGVVAATLAIFTALSLGFLVSLWQMQVARDAEQRSGRNEQRALREAYRSRISAAASAISAADPVSAWSQLDATDESQREWEWYYLRSQLDRSERLATWDEEILALAYPPGGPVFVDRQGRVASWPARAVAPVTRVDLDVATALLAAISEDGTRAALVSGDGPYALGVFDLTSGALVSDFPVEEPPRCLGLDRAGTRVAWEGASGRFVWSVNEPATSGGVRAIEATRGDGNRERKWSAVDLRDDRLAVVGRYGFAAMLELGEESATVRRLPDMTWARGRAVRFSRDGTQVAIAAGVKPVLLYDAASREKVTELVGHSAPPWCVAFGGEGDTLFSAGEDCTIRRWVGGRPAGILLGHDEPIDQLAVDATGSRVVSIDRGRTLRTWSIDAGAAREVLRGHESYVYPIAFSPDGTALASGGWDGTLRIWDVNTGTQRSSHAAKPGRRNEARLSELAYSPRGERIAFFCVARSRLEVMTVKEGTVQYIGLEGIDSVRSLDWLSEDRLVVAGGVRDGDGGVFVVDCDDGAMLARIPGRSRLVRVSPDRSLVVSAGEAGSISVMDASSLQVRFELAGHESRVNAVSFFPDGRRIASGFRDGICKVWDLESRSLVRTLEVHPDVIHAVVVSPDGRRIATGCQDGVVRIFDAETGDPLLDLRGHDDYVYSLAFSPDGSVLASGSGDTTVRLWDSVPPRARRAAMVAAEGPR